MTSHFDTSYNCIAFAAGDTSRFWDPEMRMIPGYYWPPGARLGRDPDSLKSAFEAIGYEVTDSPLVEEGYEKVALYVDGSGEWQHAAKQTADGKWSSKIGDAHDIIHTSEHCFSGSDYGSVCYYMRRKLRTV